MKKVLFVTTISGFLPQFEYNDVKILQEMDCEVHYASNFDHPVYTCDREKLIKDGIILHQIDVEKSPKKIRANFRAIRQLRRIVDDEKIDIIHCHNPMGGVSARLAGAFSRRHPYVIYTAHGFHFYKGAPLLNWLLYYTAERFCARMTDQIVTINREDLERAKHFPLRRRDAVSQIHSVGVDRVRFDERPEIKEEKRRKLKIPQDAFHIVTAAELNDNKNHRVVIEAIKNIRDQNIYYSICGKGPLEQDLKDLIWRENLDRNIRLLGYRTDMDEILQTADCFAFPSKREGLGVAAVEALLCGVPLIVADNRGTKEYARTNYNSVVCRANSPEDFEEAIRFLKNNPGEREQLAKRCRVSAMGFTREEVEKVMRRVYMRALEES